MNSRLVVEPLPPLRELLHGAAPEDMAATEGFPESRRREALAWRAIVRRETGTNVRIRYDSNGAPAIDAGGFIGVSHSRNLVAVRFSDRRCAVDTEPLDRDFSRAVGRYMTPAERALSDDRRLPAAVWCAKETLCKFAGRRGTNLLRDLRVLAVDFAAGSILGSAYGCAPLKLGIELLETDIVVYI